MWHLRGDLFLVIYKNGTIISNSAFPDTDFCGNADFVIPDDSELAKKISVIKSDIRLIFNDDGQPVDAVEIESVTHDPTPTDHDRLEALESAFAEIGSLFGGGMTAKFYTLQVKLGKIGIDEVPAKWRDKVKDELEDEK